MNFEPGTELEISRKPKPEAIQNLITESWISPRYENAERFLDWAISMPFFQLNYSDNQHLKRIQHSFHEAYVLAGFNIEVQQTFHPENPTVQ
ncbi:MAG: hypothetical protein KAR19_18270 [Bacteroidales bacterium]|nr:hypothetical protein [Bacteroidales bacterium]